MSTQFMGVFTIGQIIDRGIRLYKTVFARMFLLLLVPMLLLSTSMVMDPAALKTRSGLETLGVIYLIGMLVNLWENIIFIRYVYAVSIGETIDSFGAILTLAGPRDLLYIVTVVIWFCALSVACLLFIIPGIYLLNLAVMLSGPVCIIERRYFFDGIPRVMALGKKRWWKTGIVGSITSLVIMVPIIIAYLVSLSLATAGIAGGGGAESVVTTGVSPGVLIGMTVYVVVSALVLPLWPAVSVVYYNSLRSEKESSDLAGRLDALTAVKA